MSGMVWKVLQHRNTAMGPAGGDWMRLTHWRWAKDEEGIAWLIFDRAGESANTLSVEALAELDKALGEIHAEGARALVIRSAKHNGFVAGADIREFTGMRDQAKVEALLRDGHGVFDRLASLPMPTVAVIHGYCLGGGLELALACRYRIAVNGASFGLPEVLLGLHPGLGGTFRLPRLIDPIEAMTMMLTGRTVHTKKAKALGLVDVVVEERHVMEAVRAAARGELKRRGHGLKAAVFRFEPARTFVAKRMRKELEKRAPRSHYPAPWRLIDLWEKHGANAAAMQKAEIRSFAELITGETAQNLVRVFFLREKLKGLAKGESLVKHVHVIGAGVMGGDIAAWCAARGLRVTISDLDRKAVAKAIGRAAKLFESRLHSSLERRDALDRLIPDFDGFGIGTADLVIEAVAERADIKSKVLADVAARMRPDAILATNTSSIPLETLREGLPAPERFAGLHFFNPVPKMELVEVVSHDAVSAVTLERLRAFCGTISRLPVPVKSAPGFLVNRALMAYMSEAFLLVDEGTKKESIDRAARDFGMPMGPLELADQVGLDICLEVARMLTERLSDNQPAIPQWLVRKVEAGELGCKSGKGIYEYDAKGKRKKEEPKTGEDLDVQLKDTEIADRMILPMLNTLVRCLREGIVDDADTIDGAMIFGTGFAPFRGGPLHYARRRGIAHVREKLLELEARNGPRFEPDRGWELLFPRTDEERAEAGPAETASADESAAVVEAVEESTSGTLPAEPAGPAPAEVAIEGAADAQTGLVSTPEEPSTAEPVAKETAESEPAPDEAAEGKPVAEESTTGKPEAEETTEEEPAAAAPQRTEPSA